MKTYVITLSQVFPVTHPRKGEPTGFKEKVLAAINYKNDPFQYVPEYKAHTIRANYEFWKKRFDEINAGNACLSLRQWTSKPYCSKQVEIARLTREDGIGLQRLEIAGITTHHPIYIYGHLVDTKDLANNDGLEESDWHAWFKDYDLTEPMAVIHFTSFRY